MLELANMILKHIASKSQLEHKPLPTDDPKQRQPNIRLAKQQLDWEPVMNLEMGLKLTFEYFYHLLTNTPAN